MAILQQIFTTNFSSALTTNSLTPTLEMPGSYLYVYLAIPTMTVGYSAASTPIYVQGSYDGVTFYRFTNQETTTNTLLAGINDFTVGSSVSQRIVPIPNFGVRYLKLEISGTVTNPTAQAGVFKLIAVSNQ